VGGGRGAAGGGEGGGGGEEDAPQRGGLPVRVSTTEAKVASDEKACVSLSNEGNVI